MTLPCNMKDTKSNRELAKSMVENNNNTKQKKYCLVSVNGYLQVRPVSTVSKSIAIIDGMEVIW